MLFLNVNFYIYITFILQKLNFYKKKGNPLRIPFLGYNTNFFIKTIPDTIITNPPIINT